LTRYGRVTPADMLQLIRESGALSRTDLVRLSGLAASSVSQRVDELLSAGLIEEAGDGVSNGGRRPRLLRIRSAGGVVLAVDLGSRHARLAVVDLSGSVLTSAELPIRCSDGPDAVLTAVADRLTDLADANGGAHMVRGVGMALPGPVETASGQVTSPSRMPGWHGMRVVDWLSDRFGTPAAVDNDANLLALGEYRARWAQGGLRHLVAVKVGSGIGCGIVADGAVYHGANGAAGDISHVRVGSVDATRARLCGCGRMGCLETLASGAALLAELAAAGQPLTSTADLVEQVHRGDPAANLAVRTAGGYLGEVLAVVVNFFNPQVLVLGGALAAADPLVASLRAAIYERCLPMASEAVTITTASAGRDAGLIGAAGLILGRIAAGPVTPEPATMEPATTEPVITGAFITEAG
jgi:predicted NBD/HSP70 family sugar kinase